MNVSAGPEDYELTDGRWTIPSESIPTSGAVVCNDVNINVIGDLIKEPVERFRIMLEPVNSPDTISGSLLVTIPGDDDGKYIDYTYSMSYLYVMLKIHSYYSSHAVY